MHRESNQSTGMVIPPLHPVGLVHADDGRHCGRIGEISFCTNRKLRDSRDTRDGAGAWEWPRAIYSRSITPSTGIHCFKEGTERMKPRGVTWSVDIWHTPMEKERMSCPASIRGLKVTGPSLSERSEKAEIVDPAKGFFFAVVNSIPPGREREKLEKGGCVLMDETARNQSSSVCKKNTTTHTTLLPRCWPTESLPNAQHRRPS